MTSEAENAVFEEKILPSRVITLKGHQKVNLKMNSHLTLRYGRRNYKSKRTKTILPLLQSTFFVNDSQYFIFSHL